MLGNLPQVNKPMKRSLSMDAVRACAIALVIVAPSGAEAASITFDDFNINEGHFNLAPDYSGSTTGIQPEPYSTADRVTTAPREGAGCERLILSSNGDALARVRFLSGV